MNGVAEEIERKYAQLGYDLGWRFLACPWANLATASVALVTLNPAGTQWESPQVSVEAGSAYVIETWNGREAGTSPLQVQVRKLFELAGVDAADVLAG